MGGGSIERCVIYTHVTSGFDPAFCYEMKYIENRINKCEVGRRPKQI